MSTMPTEMVSLIVAEYGCNETKLTKFMSDILGYFCLVSIFGLIATGICFIIFSIVK